MAGDNTKHSSGKFVHTDSGADCRMTKDVSIRSYRDDDMHVRGLNQSPGFQGLDISDNVSGIFHDKPVNSAVITNAENVPTHYIKSGAAINRPWDPSSLVGPLDEAGKRDFQDYVQWYNTTVAEPYGQSPLRSNPMTHDQVLKEIGIECQKNGVSVAPVLSTDDIRAMAKAAPERIKNDRERDTGR